MTNYQMLVDAIESLQKQQDELREKVIRHETMLNQQQIKISNLQNENKILRTNNTDLKKKLVNVFKEHRIQKQQLNIIEESASSIEEKIAISIITSVEIIEESLNIIKKRVNKNTKTLKSLCFSM